MDQPSQIKIKTKDNFVPFEFAATMYDLAIKLLHPIRVYVADIIGGKPKKQIIDIATGTGAQAVELAKRGHSVVGIDYSNAMLKRAKKKYTSNLDLEFRFASAQKLPFPENSFDIATISFGLHEMPPSTAIKALQEMARVTKRSGRIIIVDYLSAHKHTLAKVAQPFINLYETKEYHEFIKLGLDYLISRSKLDVAKRKQNWGLVEIVTIQLQ